MGQAAHTGEMRNAYNNWSEKTQEKTPLRK